MLYSPFSHPCHTQERLIRGTLGGFLHLVLSQYPFPHSTSLLDSFISRFLVPSTDLFLCPSIRLSRIYQIPTTFGPRNPTSPSPPDSCPLRPTPVPSGMETIHGVRPCPSSVGGTCLVSSRRRTERGGEGTMGVRSFGPDLRGEVGTNVGLVRGLTTLPYPSVRQRDP